MCVVSSLIGKSEPSVPPTFYDKAVIQPAGARKKDAKNRPHEAARRKKSI
jgi:hypothetical protein